VLLFLASNTIQKLTPPTGAVLMQQGEPSASNEENPNGEIPPARSERLSQRMGSQEAKIATQVEVHKSMESKRRKSKTSSDRVLRASKKQLARKEARKQTL
jgi:hypothetical protein